MENFYSAVIPAKAGIQWFQGLGHPCLRRDDGEEAFFDTLVRGNDRDPLDSRLYWNDERSKSPNILFILSDDHRWDFLSCLGHPFVETPRLDRLAAEGILFSMA